jgi:hypothetical protein
MRSRFRLRALVLITFLLGEGTFVHVQDWLSKESSASYRDREAKQVVHSFDYRESNRTIGIDFGGTALIPKAEGHANVKTKEVGAKIETHVRGLEPARTLDPSKLTYVLWAVAPDLAVQNLGELRIKNGNGMLASFSDLPRFAMMVTAEPYFAVKRPSNYIALYNLWRPKTEEFVRADLLPLRIDEKTPLDIYEARNAMRIAREAGAERYAEDAFHRALQLLQQAESMIAIRKERDIPAAEEKARQATEVAENARATAEQHQQEATAVGRSLPSDN